MDMERTLHNSPSHPKIRRLMTMNSNMIAVAHADPGTVHTLVTALSAAGYESAGALNFRDAIKLVADCRPAVLVAGLELGAFNGLHLALRCATDYPSMKIVVVGPADADIEREACKQGVSAYVRRPAEPEVVVEHALAAMAATMAPLVAPPAVTHA